jgi:predicted peptidase
MPLLLRAASVVLLAAMSFASAAETQTVQSFARTISRTVAYQYLLHLPAGYTAGTERQWPLLVFLHGAGERGSDPWLVAKHGPPKLLHPQTPAPENETPEAASRRQESSRLLATQFIVISPQCPANTRWDDEAVSALIDEVAAKHAVDPRRIYLTGLSMGGFGTWSLAARDPGRFAAIVPVCGGGQRIDFLLAARERKAALQTLGVWVFHGAKDPTVPLEESERMVAALKQFGLTDLKFTVYPEARHDSWTEAYANPALYTWLLTHQR